MISFNFDHWLFYLSFYFSVIYSNKLTMDLNSN